MGKTQAQAKKRKKKKGVSMQKYQDMVEIFERDYPALWRLVYPRTYRELGAYHSPKIPAVMFADAAVLFAHFPERARADFSFATPVYRMLCECAKHAFPTYFVENAMLQAVARTTPPGDLEWKDIPMPHPGLVFILPRGALRHPHCGEIGWIAVARTTPGESPKFAYGDDPRLPPAHALTAMTSAHEHVDVAAFVSSLHPHSPTLGHIKKIAFSGDSTAVTQDIKKGELAFGAFEPEDTFFSQSILEIGASLTLAMSSRPELVEPGALIKRAKPSAARPSGLEIWSPTVIGRQYRITVAAEPPATDLATAGGTGHGAGTKKRMHWRRGHFLHQAHGPNRSLRRIQWREPVLVGEL
jgi:hypothetical protein